MEAVLKLVYILLVLFVLYRFVVSIIKYTLYLRHGLIKTGRVQAVLGIVLAVIYTTLVVMHPWR